MKASVFREFGDPGVLHLEEIQKPEPGPRDLLVRIHATPVSFADRLVRNFRAVGPQQFHMPLLFWLIGRVSFGIRRPRIHVLGSEFSGEVEAVGARVRRFAPGTAVFGYCGPRMGAAAEYLCIPEDGFVARKPANLSHEEAATVPYGAMMALDLLKGLALAPGHQLLVNGASGGIGPLVLQIAKHHFGVRVTGVCSTSKADMVRALGADEVIDYTRDDFTTHDTRYDAVVDILGKSRFADVRRVLSPGGRLVFVSFKERQLLQMVRTALGGGQRVLCRVLHESQENLELARDLVEAGKIRVVVDRVFPLQEAAQAHSFAADSRRRGQVVLAVPSNGRM